MEFVVKTDDAHKTRTDCLIVGIFNHRRLSASAESVDRKTRGLVRRVIGSSDIKGGVGQSLVLHNPAGLNAERVLLVGFGDRSSVDHDAFCKALDAAARALARLPARNAVSCLSEIEVAQRDLAWNVEQQVIAFDRAIYQFTGFKANDVRNAPALRRIGCHVGDAEQADIARHAARAGRAIADAIRLARELGNLPPNHCTPSVLAARAQAIGKAAKSISVKVLEQAQMEKLGMGALLAVARGSRESPKLIVMQYRGADAKQAPIVLIGKGVTFDSGGISIKPAAAMDEMKFDMCGAASVLGSVQAAAALALPINLVGLVPATENLPDGNACKPGDVVRTMSGQTVEILNTDAEGRLILCDTMTYCRQFKPEIVIDIATLTGACVVALGHHASGLLTNDDELAAALLKAGTDSRDRAWRLPLWDDYQKELDSNFADMANVGGRYAGTITAACFLSRFAKDLRWAHLDIAGTAWLMGKDKGATGRPVPLLMNYLRSRAAESR